MKTQFRQLFEAFPDAMLIVDPSGEISDANGEAGTLFGYRHDQMCGRHIGTLFVGQPLWDQLARESRGRSTTHYLELAGTRSDRSQFPARVHLLPIQTARGATTLVRITDITPEQRAELALELGVDVLGSAGLDRETLLGHLLRAQQEERNRIAAGIHDDTVQMLSAAHFSLEQLRLRMHEPDHLRILDRLANTLSLSMGRLRQLIFDLRPAISGNAGLAAALRAFLDEMRSETGIAYRFEDSRKARASDSTNNLIYQTAREALVNVRKHAQAKTVRVQLRDLSNGCLVRITDDGAGYNPADVESRQGHLGLILMRERMQTAGGWCRIESMPGGGTTVEFWAPLQVPRGRPEVGHGRAA
jgi:PAS domain S-box-containing protein